MFMLDIVWKVARHVTAWRLWQSGMTRSGFPISPPVPPGQRELQAPSQAHTFANCRQSVPKARGWMPLTKRCEPQAEPAPLSLPSKRRFSWTSIGLLSPPQCLQRAGQDLLLLFQVLNLSLPPSTGATRALNTSCQDSLQPQISVTFICQRTQHCTL